MAHYTNAHLLDVNIFKTGDTFMMEDGDVTYEVVFVRKGTRLYAEGVYPEGFDQDNIVVARDFYRGKFFYRCIANGDWEGSAPIGTSVEEALALRIMHGVQWAAVNGNGR